MLGQHDKKATTSGIENKRLCHLAQVDLNGFLDSGDFVAATEIELL